VRHSGAVMLKYT